MNHLKQVARLVAFLIATTVIPACVVSPGGTGRASSGTSGSGGTALAGSWSGNWTNDGNHPIAFTVSSSGAVTGGSLVHPGGATDRVTGGSLTLAGTTVSGQLTFDGFFNSATFVFSATTFTAPSRMSGSLMPTGGVTGLMSVGGPFSLSR